MVDQSTQALRKGLALAMACDHPDEIADWDINAIRDTLAEAGLAIVPVEPMSTAPMDGSEVVVYRPDAGFFTAQYGSEASLTPENLWTGDESDEEQWWSAGGYDDLSGDLAPTHWLNLSDLNDYLYRAAQETGT